MGWFKQVKQFFTGILGASDSGAEEKKLPSKFDSSQARSQSRDPRGGSGYQGRRDSGRPPRQQGSGGGYSSRRERPSGGRWRNDRGPRPAGERGQADRGPGDRGPSYSSGGQGRGGGRRFSGRSQGGQGGSRFSERLPKEERKFLVGTVTHYFPKVQAAIVKVQKGAIQLNDLLFFEGATTNFRHKVTSLQKDHQAVTVGRVGEEVGVQVNQLVNEGDQVYRVDYIVSR